MKIETRETTLAYLRSHFSNEEIIKAYMNTKLSVFGDMSAEEFAIWSKENIKDGYEWNEILGMFYRILG